MKMIKFATILLGVIAVQAISDEEVFKQWDQFQKEYGKAYKSPVEERKRLAIFKANLEEYEAHNERYHKGEVTFTKGVNQFADWTDDEFLDYVNKFKYVRNEKPVEVFEGTRNFTAPAWRDWRNGGILTPVKTQGECGACWSFSSTGAIEALNALKYNNLVSLSEQNLLDCATSGSYGCKGGYMTVAFTYVRDHGIVTEEQYPYEGVQRNCRQNGAVARLSGYMEVAQNEATLEEAVALQPVSIIFEATSQFKAYSGGVFDDPTCGQNLNHAVLAVGYNEENGLKYWIVKNSWGPGWGEAGYFRIARGKNTCGLINMASFPTV